jgi:hypothetical protein
MKELIKIRKSIYVSKLKDEEESGTMIPIVCALISIQSNKIKHRIQYSLKIRILEMM